jgi:HK97 family phage prohead protease
MDPAVDTAEIHYLPVGFALEAKSVAETKEEAGAFGTFRGYGSVFNNLECDYGVVCPGAFKHSLARQTRVKKLWQRRSSESLGSFTSLRGDDKGLLAEGRINLGTEKGREADALLKAGDMGGLSIGYRVKDFEVEKPTGVRFLKELDLIEMSLVTLPANQHDPSVTMESVPDVYTVQYGGQGGNGAPIGAIRRTCRSCSCRIRSFTYDGGSGPGIDRQGWGNDHL